MALTWSDQQIVQQVVAQLPWGQNVTLLDKLQDDGQRLWYARAAIEHGWTRDILVHQIETRLHERQGRAITNFDATMEPVRAAAAADLFKDPYVLDFVDIAEDAHERHLERALIERIKDLLLELGKGFSFMGSQYRLDVAGQDYYLDLLFYHTRLHSYVVIDLKMGEFEPEFAGEMNFYLAAVDDKLRTEGDNSSIGLILCRGKNGLIVELDGSCRLPFGPSCGFHLYRANRLPIPPYLHSIRTLSKETGLHPKRLRKLLEASGTLPECSGDLADGNCLFDAQRGSSIAREGAAATLSVRRAGEYLNAPRVQRGMLYRAGLIAPRVRGADHGCRPVCARGPGRLSRSAAGWRRARGGGRSRPGRQSGRGQTVLPLGEHGNRSEREGCGPSAEDRKRFARVSFGRAWRPSAMTGSSRLEPATGLGLICRCLHQLGFRSEFKSFVDVP
ncbi:Predicted nuclease of restriction endonuclease-like (RecB) superfamily, DUF1016 family [Bradyrhizobium erythrophlei]|nr:Predicted nuclease of restriction endonuclease-like (RecB) superfamily, DUF1016 family [Bradyrhizobium erythrophlei]